MDIRIPLRNRAGAVQYEALVSAADGDKVAGIKWRAARRGAHVYVLGHIKCNGVDKSVYLHHHIAGHPLPGQVVDHVNGDGCDNRCTNLRMVSASVNSHNRKHRGSTSMYRGVKKVFLKKSIRWEAHLSAAGLHKRFLTEESAARAHDQAAIARYGLHANLNFSESQDSSLTLPAPKASLTYAGLKESLDAAEDAPTTFQVGMSESNVCRLDAEDAVWLSRFRWSVVDGYASRQFNRRRVHMHRLILDAKPGEIVDHINGDRLDNRRVNLHVASSGQNSQNRRKAAMNATGLVGVSMTPSATYLARCCYKGKTKCLGTFGIPMDAAAAYDRFVREEYGMHGHTNGTAKDYVITTQLFRRGHSPAP